MDIKSKIKEKAIEIGFDLIGFADLSPSIYKSEYEEWIQRGFHSDMDFLVRTKEVRLSPLSRFKWAKSIIIAGINYYPGEIPLPQEGQLLISRYAMGKDYHYIINNKLYKLANFINKTTKSKRNKYYTDTGPIFEKELAQRAGLGWIGKNTLLITEEFGSWVFLGEILLDIEIEPDLPEKNKCEDCNLCVESCPSQALITSNTLNTNICTAYHTVENKGNLPDWFPSNGNRYIFGCDICQEVCPFNKNTKLTKLKDFLPKEKFINPQIEWFSGLGKEEFWLIFKNTPVQWLGYNLFMRNIHTFKKRYKKIKQQ